jgi:hypothetical protein
MFGFGKKKKPSAKKSEPPEVIGTFDVAFTVLDENKQRRAVVQSFNLHKTSEGRELAMMRAIVEEVSQDGVWMEHRFFPPNKILVAEILS